MSETQYHAGLSAEDSVGRDYMARGFRIERKRFRGTAGEIDLIASRGGETVFIEVKKSRSHEAAFARLLPRQMARLVTTASEYLALLPKGQDTPSRFDVAAVDQFGQVAILENALSA